MHPNKVKQKEWVKNNREKLNQLARERYQKRKETLGEDFMRQQRRISNARYRDKRRAWFKEYYRKNRTEILAKKKAKRCGLANWKELL